MESWKVQASDKLSIGINGFLCHLKRLFDELSRSKLSKINKKLFHLIVLRLILCLNRIPPSFHIVLQSILIFPILLWYLVNFVLVSLLKYFLSLFIFIRIIKKIKMKRFISILFYILISFNFIVNFILHCSSFGFFFFVFAYLFAALKHSPSKRKSLSKVAAQRSTESEAESHGTLNGKCGKVI